MLCPQWSILTGIQRWYIIIDPESFISSPIYSINHHQSLSKRPRKFYSEDRKVSSQVDWTLHKQPPQSYTRWNKRFQHHRKHFQPPVLTKEFKELKKLFGFPLALHQVRKFFCSGKVFSTKHLFEFEVHFCIKLNKWLQWTQSILGHKMYQVLMYLELNMGFQK